MNLVQKARNFAKAAHEGQVRKYNGEPYFVHTESVAKRVMEITDDPEMIAAAYLHDTVEDTSVTNEEIYNHFGARVAELVYDLTDQFTRDVYPNYNRKVRKELEAQRLGKISKDAQLIKLCDLADNTSDIISQDPGFAVLYLREKSYILEQMGFFSTKG